MVEKKEKWFKEFLEFVWSMFGMGLVYFRNYRKGVGVYV